MFDSQRVSRFQLLQDMQVEPSYAVFDCLYKNGHDLRARPLAARREELEKVVGITAARRKQIFPSARLASNGLEVFQLVRKKGYEGVVAKDASAPYVEGRSNKWLKIKVRQEDEFLIVGYTPPSGAREYFGALLLAAYDKGQLRYVGKLGTGFNQETLADLYRRFQPLVRQKAPIANTPRDRNVIYLAPRLVAEIAYEELTADRKLRQPVFLGLRDDKRPEDVTLPEAR